MENKEWEIKPINELRAKLRACLCRELAYLPNRLKKIEVITMYRLLILQYQEHNEHII